MSLLKGEKGTHLILYGSLVLPFGRMIGAYHARPDERGPHPTVIVAHGPRGLTPNVKSLCRSLARLGFSAISPDLYGGKRPRDAEAVRAAFAALGEDRLLRDLGDAVEAVRLPGTGWADGSRLAIIGLGEAGRAALTTSAGYDCGATVLVSTPLSEGEPPTAGMVAAAAAPVLGLFGVSDDGESAEGLREIGASAPGAELVIYREASGDFFDDDTDAFDDAIAADALDRVARFLSRTMPAQVS